MNTSSKALLFPVFSDQWKDDIRRKISVMLSIPLSSDKCRLNWTLERKRKAADVECWREAIQMPAGSWRIRLEGMVRRLCVRWPTFCETRNKLYIILSSTQHGGTQCDVPKHVIGHCYIEFSTAIFKRTKCVFCSMKGIDKRWGIAQTLIACRSPYDPALKCAPVNDTPNAAPRDASYAYMLTSQSHETPALVYLQNSSEQMSQLCRFGSFINTVTRDSAHNFPTSQPRLADVDIEACLKTQNHDARQLFTLSMLDADTKVPLALGPVESPLRLLAEREAASICCLVCWCIERE